MNKILFKHADERWKWIGISETLRNILEFFPSWDIITTEDMMTYISKEYLNQKLNEKILNEKLNEKLNRIIMEIRDNPLLFTYKKNKGLFFHFNFSDIYFALKKNLIKKINIAIYKGNNKTGVYKGKFVTPTLNIIDKFINTDIFFEVNNLLDSVASNLAFGCTPYIEKNNQKLPIEILVDSKVSFKLIDKFRERLNNILGGQKGYKKQDIWIQILGPTDYPAVRGKKSNVIIFSDIISSSNKVIWLSSRAMRVNRVPITIITAMDARLVKSKTLEVLGNKIRLFAIAKIILQTKDKSLPYSSLE